MIKKDQMVILKKQIRETQKLITGLDVKYMWGWIEKLWPFGAFILGKTIFLKRSLGARAQQGLVAHDADHIMVKAGIGCLKYRWLYATSPEFRAAAEVRGYALSLMVAEAQGYLYDAALRKYAYLLHSKYKLQKHMTKQDLRELIDDTVTQIKEYQLQGSYMIFAAWKRAYEGWV